MPGRAPIIRRLDAALAKMRDGEMEVRAIYLNPDDWDAYNAAQSEAYGTPLVSFRYGPHEIRSTENNSTIYSTRGVGVSVPKRVPND